MKIEIKPYKVGNINSVIDFNIRLKSGGTQLSFLESNIPNWLPKCDDMKIFQESFLALENDSIVRGAYMLKQQEFSFKGDVVSIASYHQPISEGIVNKKYNSIGIRLIIDGLNRQPLLFALGMGGYDEQITKVLEAMRWDIFSIPFYFKIVNVQHFLRNLTYFRNTKLKRLLLDLIYVTGLGLVSHKFVQFFFKWARNNNKNVSYVDVKQFSSWANDLWDRCKNKYDMIAVRDMSTLNILYPSNSNRFIRLLIKEDDNVIGWAVVLNTKMVNHKQFGNMRLGSIVDCLSLQEHAQTVVISITEYLENNGVDLIVSNQSNDCWCSALKKTGFIKGPSNFILATSKKLSRLMHTTKINIGNIHLNRGDGDGPINL